MAKDVKFNIRLNIDGKEQIVTASTNVKRFAEELGIARTKSTELRDSLIRITQVGQSFQNALMGLQQITGLMSQYTAASKVQVEAETKLKTVMQERMNATEGDIEHIKQLTAEQQRLGVIGDEVQIAGAQQVATFLNEKSSLDVLIPAMNNLIAQQRGLEASSSDAVSVANLMGKAMQGQTQALTRVGITFDAAQEQVMKFGTESQRAAMLAQIITDNVGDMNAELAKTDAGKAKQTANAIGDIKEQVGALFSSVEPTITAVAELGLALSALGTMGSGIRGIYVAVASATTAIKGMTVVTLAQNAAGRVATLVQSLWAKQLYYGRQAQLAWAFSAKLATVQALAMRGAILGLMAVTGVGLAFAAVSSIISLFASNTDDATQSMKRAEDEAKKMSSAGQEEAETYNQVSSTLNIHKEKLRQLIDQKKKGVDVSKDEKKIVQELNGAYGETMGYFSSVVGWYKALTANSETYCRQMVLEAKTRRLANQIAEKEAERHNIIYDEQGNKRLYSTQRGQSEVWKSAGGWGSYKTYVETPSEWDEATAAVAENNKVIASLSKQLQDAVKEVSLLEFSVKGSATAPTAGASTGTNTTGANTGTNTEKARQLIENARTYQDLANNVAYYNEQLEKADITDTETLLTLARKKAATEEAIKVFRDLIDVTKEADASTIDDNSITTYEELNKKLDYYNTLLRTGDDEQRKFAQNGINNLQKLQDKWQAVLDEASLPTTFDTLEDIDLAISFYSQRQQREDADHIRQTQAIIDRLTARRRTLELGMDLPSMQKEVADIEALTSREQKIRVRGIGFEALGDKIRELRDLLNDTDNPLTDSQRDEVEGLINVYARWQRQAIDTFGALREGWNGVRGIGDSIQGITNALEGNGNAWQKTTAVVDGFIKMYEDFNTVLAIMQMLTTLSEAHAVAKTTEAVATGEAAAATSANAASDVAAVASTATVVAANKVAAASFTELATAAYLAAHAAIPFAGFGIGAGFAAAAKALVLSIGATAFANGGIVNGPTLALVGEYAGASNNPEVVAPLNKLTSLLPDSSPMGGKVRFEIDGRTLVGILKKETNYLNRM